MGRCALFDYGLDIDIYIANYVGARAGAGSVVYLGGRSFVFDWGDILSVATPKVFACDLAFVCNRRQCLFLFRGPVRRDFGRIGLTFRFGLGIMRSL